MCENSINFVLEQEKKAEKIERESKKISEELLVKANEILEEKKLIIANDLEDYKKEEECVYQLKLEENKQIMLAELNSKSSVIKNKVNLNQAEVIEDIVREVVSQYGHS